MRWSKPSRPSLGLSTLLMAMALALVLVAPASAQASSFTSNERFPTDIFVYVPCAAGGAGEEVYLSGDLHVLFHITLDGKGGFHAKNHFQPQGITGTGQTTGAKYQATGVTQDQFNGKVGSTYTFINNFRIIGQGSGNNLIFHETLHMTVNANGTLTAYVDNFQADCK